MYRKQSARKKRRSFSSTCKIYNFFREIFPKKSQTVLSSPTATYTVLVNTAMATGSRAIRREAVGTGGYMEDLSTGSRIHKVTMTNRRSCIISGVKDVLSFDIHEVILETEQGMLSIKGDDLHVNRLTLEKGEVDVDGRIDSFVYSEAVNNIHKNESLLSRLFR